MGLITVVALLANQQKWTKLQRLFYTYDEPTFPSGEVCNTQIQEQHNNAWNLYLLKKNTTNAKPEKSLSSCRPHEHLATSSSCFNLHIVLLKYLSSHHS